MTVTLWNGPEPLQVSVAKNALCEVGLRHIANTVRPNRIGAPSTSLLREAGSVEQRLTARAFFLGHQAVGHDCELLDPSHDLDGSWSIRCTTCNEMTEARLEAGESQRPPA